MEQHNIVKEFISTQEKFLTLQSAVATELENKCDAMKGPWYSWKSIINIYYWTTLLLAFLVSLFLFVPLVWQLIEKIYGSNFLLFDKEIVSLFTMFTFVILPASLYGYFVKKFPERKSLVRFLEAIFLIPWTTNLIYIALYYLLENRFLPISNIRNGVFEIPFLFFLISVFITCMVAVIRSLRPNFLVLLASNRINIDLHEKSLSYELITKKVVENTYINTQLWSILEVQKVRIYGQKRSAHLSAQIQTIAPALGALSLFSLVALIFTSEQTQNIVKFFSSVLKLITETSSERSLNILIIAGIVLFTLGSFTYFVNSYWSLCVLEIIDTLCLIRIEECEKERKDIEEQSSFRHSLLYSQTYTGMLLNYLRQFSFKSSHRK
jgi:hypothetical protein